MMPHSFHSRAFDDLIDALGEYAVFGSEASLGAALEIWLSVKVREDRDYKRPELMGKAPTPKVREYLLWKEVGDEEANAAD